MIKLKSQALLLVQTQLMATVQRLEVARCHCERPQGAKQSQKRDCTACSEPVLRLLHPDFVGVRNDRRGIAAAPRNDKSLNAFVLVALCVCFLVSGCGYTTRSMISGKFRTIYVTPFKNKVNITDEGYSGDKYQIYRPTLDTDITSSVTNKFLFDGNLKPVKEDVADLILKGEVVQFRRDPLRYNESDEVSEYRISLVVNISLWDRKESKMVWKEDGFTGDTTFFTSGSQAKSEDVAIRDALSDLARRIVERAVEEW